MSPTRDNAGENALTMDLQPYSEPGPTTASCEIDRHDGVSEKTEQGHAKADYGMSEASTGKPRNASTSDGVDICTVNIGGDNKRPKYATVRSFQGKIYVDIREFYGSGGLYFPTKKGITLSASNFKSLLMVTKKINAGIYRGQQRMKKPQ